MAHSKIFLSNGVEVKAAPVGYSWTTLFFGFFPALFRQDWLWAVILFITGLVSSGIIPIIFSFFYNKVYINSLLKKGYKLHGTLPPTVTEDALKAYLGVLNIPKAD
jgi:hypothetical protein